MKMDLNALIAAAGKKAEDASNALRRAQDDVNVKRSEMKRVERRVRDKNEGLEGARKAYREHVQRFGAGHFKTKQVSNAVTESRHQLNELEAAFHARRSELERLEAFERSVEGRFEKADARYRRFTAPEFARLLKKRAQRIRNRAERQAEKAERKTQKEQAAIRAAAPAPAAPVPAGPDLGKFAEELGIDLASLAPEDRQALEELARGND